MSVSLLAARWVLPVTTPPIDHGAVAVEFGRIRAVGSLQDLRQQFPGAQVTDFGSSAILPGLVNVHSHLELTALRGRIEVASFQQWIVQLVTLKAERLTTADLLTSARLGCIEALRSGITTLADTADAAATREALIESGLRAVIFQECFGPAPEQAEAGLDQLRLKLDAHHDRIARAATAASRLRVGISPHAPYSVSARLYRLATRFAIDHQLDMAIHAAESQAEQRLLADGSGAFGDSFRRRAITFEPPECPTVTYFERLGVLEAAPLLIHGVTIADHELPTLAAHGVRLAHCPKSNSKFGHGVASLQAWQQHGISVGLGTDSVVSNNNCDLIEEARYCALLHRAHRADSESPTAAEMLRLMTIDGARTLRLDGRIGSIEPGKNADLIAIDLSRPHNSPVYDPVTAIVFSASARDVVMTMVDGNILYDGRNVLTLDETEVLHQAGIVGEKLV